MIEDIARIVVTAELKGKPEPRAQINSANAWISEAFLASGFDQAPKSRRSSPWKSQSRPSTLIDQWLAHRSLALWESHGESSMVDTMHAYRLDPETCCSEAAPV